MTHENAKQKKKAKRVRRSAISFPLFYVTIVLLCIGCIMVLSSTYAGQILDGEDSMSLFIQHAAASVVCVVMMFLISRFDYRNFNKKPLVILALVICTALLGAVFLVRDRGGAHRWIELGSFTLQPSEIAKFVLVFFLAWYLAGNVNWYKSFKTWAIPFGPIILFAALIVIEPNLSTTAICILIPSILLLFIAGMQKWLVALGGAAVTAGAICMMMFVGWRSDRVHAWLDPFFDPQDKSYQIVQSLYALGGGNLWGVGLGNSRQKISNLPMADTDYIFAIIAEEFGFIGAVAVILLYAAFIFMGLRIAMNAPDRFGCYLASGITIIVAMQVIVNIGVVTNLIPSTGVTLPFISRGTSSLLAFSAATGILLSISAYSTRRAPRKKQKDENGEDVIRRIR